ncbi:MAG: 16S rRNA (adenine(1518)-N(6)/adenine(1519)-N(6))-dimethyltransferase [Planctomycetota bacterium]|nr:MAG: 16S rRNA (adenine(1518)-N(6)/adenine(1519)-N(6))-dimethyltransferase [Planctomycetota bacterium]
MKGSELRRLLAEHGLSPSRRRGQNFLVDPALLASIPVDAGVRAGERVLEVGPGAGSLTAELLAAGARVFAIELDRGLVALLRERFAADLAAARLRLVEGDVLDRGNRFHPAVEAWWREGPAPRLVANLPYSISGPFLGRLPGRRLVGACLLLQREVAEKALAGARGGPLGVRLALAFHGRLGRRLPPAVFWPPPRVESTFLHLEPHPGGPGPELDRVLTELLREGFSQRRKALLARLRRRYPAAAAALAEAGVGERTRPEEVGPDLWLAAAARAIIADS